MRKLVALCVGILLGIPVVVWGQEAKSKELERVQASEKVLHEVMATPDKGIPEEILSGAECVAVVPSMLKGGFVFGGRYGRGVATCRTSASHWSAPAPIRIEGGSWGLQIGGQAVDLVMVVMNKQGMQNLLSSKFKIGADASAAAGPVGRHVEGSTDWKMRAQVLTYSRARGAFAGVTLNGAVVKQDTDDTLALYGKFVPFQTILTGKVPPPQGTQPFVAEVGRYFREANGTQAQKSREKAESKEAKASTGNTSGGTAGTASSSSSGQTGSENMGAVAGSAQTGTNTGSNSTTTESNQSSMTQSSGMSTDDVQSKIQNALQNTPGLSANSVNVNVSGDTVTLTGSVPTEKDKTSVVRIAQQNAGGRKVDDSGLNVK